MTDHLSQLCRDSSAPMVAVGFEEDESVYLVDVCFKVEDLIFKVPRRPFEESAMFRDLFQVLAVEKAIPDGVSLDNPLYLEGIVKNDFKQLVRFMVVYPRLPPKHEISLSVPDYVSVLKLSTMWEFETIRDTVIQELSALRIDVVEKITLARDYGVTQWFLPSLDQYAHSPQPVTLEDVDRLGLDYVLKILRERQLICDYSYHNFTQALQSAFKDEIDGVESWNSRETTGHIYERQFQNDDSFRFVDIFFLVENCLFKGHRQSFEVSPIFCDMFRLPVMENAMPDGFSKEQPLHLDGIEKADFKQLLRFMNASSMSETQLSLPEWTSVLKLSMMWQFTEIREFVIHQISELQIHIVEKIVLAREYHISELLFTALDEYVKQKQPVTTEDVNRLGLAYILKILRVRDNRDTSRRMYHDFTHALRSAFENEPGRSTWSMQKMPTAPVVVTSLLPPMAEDPLPPCTKPPDVEPNCTPTTSKKPKPTPETSKRRKTLRSGVGTTSQKCFKKKLVAR